jgi:hypothetical protein
MACNSNMLSVRVKISFIGTRIFDFKHLKWHSKWLGLGLGLSAFLLKSWEFYVRITAEDESVCFSRAQCYGIVLYDAQLRVFLSFHRFFLT